jgi:hypothetical protein
MKKNMRTRCFIFALVCAAVLALPPKMSAQVSEEDFKALKEAVQKLGEKVQKLEETHTNDVITHQRDMEQIQQLREKVNATQQAVTNAELQGASAEHIQTLLRAPIDEATVNHNFLMLGDAEFQYAKLPGLNGTFLQADFAPIFLYRGGDRILFEAGFDTTIQNSSQQSISNPGTPNETITSARGPGYSTTFNLTFAQLSYIVAENITFEAGEMLLPLGTYAERGAGWLNKIPNDPIARSLLPGTGVGAQFRGAIPLDDQGKLLNYSVFGVNGPSSADGTGNAGELDLGGNVGLRSDNMVANLHGSPSGGGRLGVFMPFKPHYDLELGISGQSGEWDDAGAHQWMAGVFDASLHLGSFLEAKGEFIQTSYGSDDLGLIRPQGWWLQAGYKLAGLNLDFPGINNLELVGRWEGMQDGIAVTSRRYCVGYVYYVSNTLLFEGNYQFLRGNAASQPGDQFILQLSLGF